MTCVRRLALLAGLLCTLFAFGQKSTDGTTPPSSQKENRNTLRVDVDLTGLSNDYFQL